MEKLIILCGPSGTGKTTIQNHLLEQYNIPKVLTHTTRAKRKGEKNGVDYYFETPESFTKNHYFESINYDGKQYGSSREGLEKAWQKNPIVSLVVDTFGAIQYVKRLGKKVTVWHIEVTDPQVLKQRLIERGDNPALVKQRMNSFESQRLKFQQKFKIIRSLLEMMIGNKRRKQSINLLKKSKEKGLYFINDGGKLYAIINSERN